MNNIQRIEHIKQCLTTALQPSALQVIDESDLHKGHSGAQSGRGHFAVYITATAFINKSRLAQHRLVYAALGSFMETDIHALRIVCST